MICVKPGRLGGISSARQAQALCADSGTPAYCGGMLETNLARTVNAALSGLPGFTVPGDLAAGERFVERDPFLAGAPGSSLEPTPELAIHRGPGVGPAPDPVVLDAVTTRREWFAV